MKTQKEAVCSLLLTQLNDDDKQAVNNKEVTIKSVLTPANKASVREELVKGFNEGEIQMSDQAKAKYVGNETGMKTYVNGLVNNWIKKNPDFNCGVKYKPENPGSRTGQSDDQIKNMRALLSGQTDPKVIAEIQGEINKRLAEIKPSKVIVIDVDCLPEGLKHLVE